jgi:hypothetical protein
LKPLTHLKFLRNRVEQLVGDVRNWSARKWGWRLYTNNEECLNKEQGATLQVSVWGDKEEWLCSVSDISLGG